MNKITFYRWYQQWGTDAAVEAAIFFGVSRAQVDLWLFSSRKAVGA